MKKKRVLFFVTVLLLSAIIYIFIADNEGQVKVLFTTESDDELSINFHAKEDSFFITLGRFYENSYSFENRSSDTLYFRPIHSVFPSAASSMYTMTKCFCFDDMVLMPHETLILPLSFKFYPNLDPSVKKIVMHYQLVRRKKEDVITEEDIP